MDKILLKITGIVVIVIGVCYCFTIIGAIIGIPLIIGGSKFLGYSDMSDQRLIEEKSNILGWSIFFLFFTVVGGVIGLLFYFQLSGVLTKFDDIISGSNNKKEDYIDEIARLKKLYEDGAITKAEYEEKKKKLLNL